METKEQKDLQVEEEKLPPEFSGLAKVIAN